MKIKLVGATFYMNDPIYLTPIKKEADFDLSQLDDKVIRILAAGISNGLVVISEGNDEFLTRVDMLSTKNTKPTEVVEEKPKTVEVKETVKVEEAKVKQTEATEEVKTPAKKATTAKATTAKKTTTTK